MDPPARTEPTGAHIPDRPVPETAWPRPTDRIRVLWLVKGLGPGGTERLLASAAGVHDHEQFRIEAAYVVPHKSQLVPQLEGAGVPVHRLGAPGDRRGAWLWRLRRLLATGDHEVVHLHSPVIAGAARIATLTLPSARRPRLMSTEHNAWQTFAWPTRLLNAATWGVDDAHLAVSEDARASVRRRRSAPVEYLLHGTDVRALDAARGQRDRVRRALGVSGEDVLVGTVANYRPQKAYPNLMEAAGRVLAAAPHARFVAVGQGPEEAAIRQAHAQLGLGDRFALLGYRSDPEAVLAACDVFVLASHFEGYPVALMEALGLGLPVVATRVGGVPDAVRDGVEGLLVPPADAEALADALLAVIRDPALRAQMAAAAEVRGARYDITHAVRRTEEIYRQLAGRVPSRTARS